MLWSQDDWVLAAPAPILSEIITINFSTGYLYQFLFYFQGKKDMQAYISLISPKITGFVAVSGANMTHPLGLYRCGMTGEGGGGVVCTSHGYLQYLEDA